MGLCYDLVNCGVVLAESNSRSQDVDVSTCQLIEAICSDCAFHIGCTPGPSPSSVLAEVYLPLH